MIKKCFYILLVFQFVVVGLHAGDSGSIKMSWNEFKNGKRDLGPVVLSNFRAEQRIDNEKWTKIKIHFNAKNKVAQRIKIQYVLAIFDAAGKLIFASGEDHNLGSYENDATHCESRIPSGMRFKPSQVHFRAWSSVKKR